MRYTYKTRGTCSVEIRFDLEGDVVRNIEFERGCNGNAKGVSSLAEGMDAHDLIKRLEGIKCDERRSSCPDQLAKAVKLALEEREAGGANGI